MSEAEDMSDWLEGDDEDDDDEYEWWDD